MQGAKERMHDVSGVQRVGGDDQVEWWPEGLDVFWLWSLWPTEQPDECAVVSYPLFRRHRPIQGANLNVSTAHRQMRGVTRDVALEHAGNDIGQICC